MHAILALVLAAAEPAPQTVTLPLEEYEALRKLRERPSLTVIDQLRVVGSFGGHDLAVELAGRASGTQPTVGVLSGEGYRPYACEGEALLSRADSGAFALTPLAPRFRLRCRIALDGSDRLEAVALAAVLEVTAAVADGELVVERGEAEGRPFSVVRRIQGDGGPALPPSVAAHYRVTLLPDETLFLYRLEVRNPGRRHRAFEIALRDSEHVESLNAPVAWDVEGTRYRFDLPPGETTLELTGRLTATAFVPPVAASIQYLLLESHPLIRPDVRTAAKRVGVGEVGIPPQHRGAQAFLLDGGSEVAWTATRLEALKTAGFAVRELEQVFFLGADGTARGETRILVDNQGAPALALPVAGEPTFASVQGEPVFLTRDAQGRLFLPLAQGEQRILTQDARPFSMRLGLGIARLELPRLGAAASQARLQLRYPAEWIPLFDSLAPTSRLHVLPSDLLVLALLLALVERVLALGGVARRPRLLLAGAVVLVAALAPDARAALVALAAAPLVVLGAAHAWRNLSPRWRLGLAVGAGALALLTVMVSVNVVGGGRREAPGLDSTAYGSKAFEAESDAAVAKSPAPPAAGRDAYEGLPARIDLPGGTRSSHFSREMVARDAAAPVTVVMVAARALSAAAWLAGALALALAFRFRAELAAGARRFGDRVRGGPRPERGGAAAPA